MASDWQRFRPFDGAASSRRRRHPPARGKLDSQSIQFASLAGLFAFALFLSNSTHALMDDGPQLVQDFADTHAPPVWNHLLYFPVVRLVASIGWSADQAMLLTNACAGACMVALAACFATVLTGSRALSVLAAASMVTAPLVFTHATFIEVHALHGACVAAALLAILTAPAGPRSVVWIAASGAALAVISHRSGVFLAPSMAGAAAAKLIGVGVHRQAAWRTAGVSVVGGSVVALVLDWAVHRWVGGPGPFASVQQIESAHVISLTSALWEESVLALGPLLLLGAIAAPWAARVRRRNAARQLLCALPLVTFVVYALGILTARVPTQGGYWIGASPFFVLGLILSAERLLLSRVIHVRVAMIAGPAVVSACAFLAQRHAESGGVREALHSQRNARIAAACAVMPLGGHLLSSGLNKQYVDGAAQGIREHGFGSEIGMRLMAGESPASIAHGLRAVVDELLAMPAAGTVAWTSEWRETIGVEPFAPLMETIEQTAFRGLRTTMVPFGESVALVLERAEKP